jgi:hypothetical protein
MRAPCVNLWQGQVRIAPARGAPVSVCGFVKPEPLPWRNGPRPTPENLPAPSKPAGKPSRSGRA